MIETSITKAGRDAYQSGQKILENPYLSSQYCSYLEWQTGWLQEQSEDLLDTIREIAEDFNKLAAVIYNLS